LTNSFTNNKTYKIPISISIVVVIVSIDFLSVQSMNINPTKKYYLEQSTPQPNFQQAYEYIKYNIGEDDVIISPYPYMDLIFLDKFDYVLPISYTGDVDDVPVHNGIDFYTGAPEIVDILKIQEINKNNNIYFIFDNMGYSRVDRDILKYIELHAEDVYVDEKNKTRSIIIFKMSKNIN